MKDKRVVVSFAAGVVVAAALGGIYFLVEDIHPTASHLVEDIHPTASDDDRVVVAGGSLEIQSLNGCARNTNGTYTAIHIDKNRIVTGGNIIIDGKPLPPGSWPVGPIKFEIAYCAGACKPNTPDDLITVETDSNGKRLRFTNTNLAHKLGDEAAAAPDPKNIVHQPDTGKVMRIRDVLSNKNYPCTNGLCSILATYHCDVKGDCK
jgi:hypothetical protein